MAKEIDGLARVDLSKREELATRPEKFSASIDSDTLLIPACGRQATASPREFFRRFARKRNGYAFLKIHPHNLARREKE